MKILVMNGPNINFLGIREKGIYGEQNYEALVSMIEKKAEELGVDVEVFQSNHEGAIIDKIQEAYYNDVDGIVINPGAFTHYSYAVRDALASVAAIPKVKISGDIEEFTQMIWDNLNADNKVSLFVRYIDIATGEYETRIINKNVK